MDLGEMRVLLVVPWNQRFGGVASVVGLLARYLEEQGHQPLFLFPGDSDRIVTQRSRWGFDGYETYLRVPFEEFHLVKSALAFLAFLPSTLFRLARFVREHQVEVVNIHFPQRNFLYFAILRWVLPLRLVVSVHGADLFPAVQGRNRIPLSVKSILRAADRVVAPSSAFGDDVVDALPNLESKVSPIENGLDLSELDRSERSNYARPDGSDGSDRYVLCVANHNERKGIDILLRAFARAADVDSEIGLRLVGDGPLRRELEALAERLDIAERTTFHGALEHPDVISLLWGCELFALPSRLEPFGIAALEAMACGKPVIATRVGGLPQFVTDGETGILVEPDDQAGLAQALTELIRSGESRERLGRSARAAARRFGYERSGGRYLDLFRALAGHPHQERQSPA